MKKAKIKSPKYDYRAYRRDLVSNHLVQENIIDKQIESNIQYTFNIHEDFIESDVDILYAFWRRDSLIRKLKTNGIYTVNELVSKPDSYISGIIRNWDERKTALDYLKLPSEACFCEYLSHIRDTEPKTIDFLIRRCSGDTLQTIGDGSNLTRERIRQIVLSSILSSFQTS